MGTQVKTDKENWFSFAVIRPQSEFGKWRSWRWIPHHFRDWHFFSFSPHIFFGFVGVVSFFSKMWTSANDLTCLCTISRPTKTQCRHGHTREKRQIQPSQAAYHNVRRSKKKDLLFTIIFTIGTTTVARRSQDPTTRRNKTGETTTNRRNRKKEITFQ